MFMVTLSIKKKSPKTAIGKIFCRSVNSQTLSNEISTVVAMVHFELNFGLVL